MQAFGSEEFQAFAGAFGFVDFVFGATDLTTALLVACSASLIQFRMTSGSSFAASGSSS
jgi:hypothetical protein